ncbi:MAG: hypothetical protein QF733_10015 [Phycisphaerales bacterium]|jgi:hypothetical protein|nr:hypothetical protein [Phycisphaerales bacterium]
MPVLAILTVLLTVSGRTAAPLLAPDLLPRDVPVVLEALAVEGDTASIVASLLENYLAEDAQAVAAATRSLAAVDREPLDADWTPRDWTARHQDWARIRERASQMDDPGEAAAWLAGQREWARGVLAELVEQTPPSPLSDRGKVLRALTADRRARHATLQRDVELVLESDRGRWEHVEQAIRRDRSHFRGGLAGEMLDLQPLVARAAPEAWRNLQPLLAEYERAWSAAAAARDAVLASQWPYVLDAADRRDRLSILALEAAEVAARRRVVEVNQDWYRRLSEALPEAAVNPFQRAVNRAWYPDIFAPSRAERTVAHLLADPEVPEPLKEALVQSRIRFGGPKLRLAAEERAARRAAAGRARTARAEQRAMAEVFGPTALFRMSVSDADRSLSEAASLASRRRAIDVSWLQHLRGLLGSERWAAVPDEILIGPVAPADVPKGEDGQPLRLRLMP